MASNYKPRNYDDRLRTRYSVQRTYYLLHTYRYRYSTSPPAITLCQQCANSVLTALLVQCANTTSGLGVDTPRMEKCANSVLTLVRKAWLAALLLRDRRDLPGDVGAERDQVGLDGFFLNRGPARAHGAKRQL